MFWKCEILLITVMKGVYPRYSWDIYMFWCIFAKWSISQINSLSFSKWTPLDDMPITFLLCLFTFWIAQKARKDSKSAQKWPKLGGRGCNNSLRAFQTTTQNSKNSFQLDNMHLRVTLPNIQWWICPLKIIWSNDHKY